LHVSGVISAAYFKAKTAVAEAKIYAEAEGQFKKQLEAERALMQAEEAAGTAIRRHRVHIVETLLTLHCPRCDKAFLDFDACFALRCGGQCGTHFCAYCLKDCGTREEGGWEGSHQHVGQCQFNIAPGKDVFGKEEMFEQAQRERRQRVVAEYVATIADEAVRRGTIEACSQDLSDLGIHL
jgi:hypothetical protein